MFNLCLENILLMEEILHHLGYIKPYEYWDIYYINWCRISAINSSTNFFFATGFPGFGSFQVSFSNEQHQCGLPVVLLFPKNAVWGYHRKSVSSWWFFTNPFEKYAEVKLDHLPRVRDEHKKYWKPPPRILYKAIYRGYNSIYNW